MPSPPGPLWGLMGNCRHVRQEGAEETQGSEARSLSDLDGENLKASAISM